MSRLLAIAAAGVLATGCAAPKHATAPSAAPSPARLELSTARRLCENADSAAAGLAGCRLRDQRVF